MTCLHQFKLVVLAQAGDSGMQASGKPLHGRKQIELCMKRTNTGNAVDVRPQLSCRFAQDALFFTAPIQVFLLQEVIGFETGRRFYIQHATAGRNIVY